MVEIDNYTYICDTCLHFQAYKPRNFPDCPVCQNHKGEYMQSNFIFWAIVVGVGFIILLLPVFMLVRWWLESALPKHLVNPLLDVLTFAVTAGVLLAILWGLGAV